MPPKFGPTVVIDGHNTFIRNYVRSPYMNTNGERAGGTTGMVISVRKLIQDLQASNVLVVWDGEGGSQRRRSIYGEYKAGRTVRMNKRDDDMEEDPQASMENMRHQRNQAQEYLTMLGVPQVRCDGVEADDLMAYVSTMDFPGGCVIVSTDQDILQLIREPTRVHDAECLYTAEDERPDSPQVGGCGCCGAPWSSEVKVWSPIKKIMYDRAKFISEYEVLPENFRIVKALTGDSSDNIDGVKGFGARTVAKSFPFLMERRATAEDVLGTELKGVIGKRLQDEKSRFLENLVLVDLSSPMLSATAARQARDALRKEMGCHEVDFRVRLVRDGISFGGDNFVGPFRDLAMRRKRLLVQLPPAVEYITIDATIDTDNVTIEEKKND